MEFCADRGLCIGNIYFKHRSLQKYIRIAKAQDGVEVKSMIDLVLVKDMLHYVVKEECESSERNGNGTRPLRSTCGTVQSQISRSID